ncbi:hypothetical protein THOM_1539 [Trachipleistophora hominis]|uniref:Uncharacterized protein n=1 Tax=Trachipleistophora hominis TaxID=72359 RepID=L7JVP4_TRAHO|nr:hypothetical protein THOM_1539 [Trachipleistophora hominis]
MKIAKHLLKLVKDVYLTVHIRSPHKYLSSFLHVEQLGSFITGLCAEYCINERNQASLARPKVINKREVINCTS